MMFARATFVLQFFSLRSDAVVMNSSAFMNESTDVTTSTSDATLVEEIQNCKKAYMFENPNCTAQKKIMECYHNNEDDICQVQNEAYVQELNAEYTKNVTELECESTVRLLCFGKLSSVELPCVPDQMFDHFYMCAQCEIGYETSFNQSECVPDVKDDCGIFYMNFYMNYKGQSEGLNKNIPIQISKKRTKIPFPTEWTHDDGVLSFTLKPECALFLYDKDGRELHNYRHWYCYDCTVVDENRYPVVNNDKARFYYAHNPDRTSARKYCSLNGDGVVTGPHPCVCIRECSCNGNTISPKGYVCAYGNNLGRDGKDDTIKSIKFIHKNTGTCQAKNITLRLQVGDGIPCWTKEIPVDASYEIQTFHLNSTNLHRCQVLKIQHSKLLYVGFEKELGEDRSNPCPISIEITTMRDQLISQEFAEEGNYLQSKKFPIMQYLRNNNREERATSYDGKKCFSRCKPINGSNLAHCFTDRRQTKLEPCAEFDDCLENSNSFGILDFHKMGRVRGHSRENRKCHCGSEMCSVGLQRFRNAEMMDNFFLRCNPSGVNGNCEEHEIWPEVKPTTICTTIGGSTKIGENWYLYAHTCCCEEGCCLDNCSESQTKQNKCSLGTRGGWTKTKNGRYTANQAGSGIFITSEYKTNGDYRKNCPPGYHHVKNADICYQIAIFLPEFSPKTCSIGIKNDCKWAGYGNGCFVYGNKLVFIYDTTNSDNYYSPVCQKNEY